MSTAHRKIRVTGVTLLTQGETCVPTNHGLGHERSLRLDLNNDRARSTQWLEDVRQASAIGPQQTIDAAAALSACWG
jgi:hypothetical protein